jgi:DeoR/GlpR family transcriptional regulator of sugar metabolism
MISSSMFAEERQNKILEELKRKGRVEVSVLAKRYKVSEHTIRRDLSIFAKHGYVQKTHGGGVMLETAKLSLQDRKVVLTEAKDEIAQLAAKQVQAGQTLILETGSTVLAFARHLEMRPLTIITNSLDIAALFDNDSNIQLIVTGGVWNNESRAFRGRATEDIVSQYRADWTVLGTCALHPKAGLTVTDENDVALKQAMLRAGTRSMILADHSKRDVVVTYLVLNTTQLDLVVTDQPWVELEKLGVQILVSKHQA